MVEPEVPDRGKRLTERDECACSSDYGTRDDVPVMMVWPKMRQVSRRLQK